MNKLIFTPKMQKEKELYDQANELIICNISPKKRVFHCKNLCFHGIPHQKEGQRNSCHTVYETCSISNSKVICRSLTSTEKSKWVKENL